MTEIMNIEGIINGKTHVYGVIGNPIEHTFSPVIHNTIASAMGHNNIYVPFHVQSEDLEAAIMSARALGIKGLNVTIPHKKEVMRYCSPDGTAEAIGAVNTLKLTPGGYEGFNTDYIGIRKTFERRGISLSGKTVAVIGAGGSAYAACVACAGWMGQLPKKIFIINRTIENAKNLANHINKYYNTDITVLPLENAADAKTDIAIQTTSQGFGNQSGGTPVDNMAFFKHIEAVLDIIYIPWETKFMQQAAQAGVKVVNGFDMLIYQAIASYEIWNGITISDAAAELIRTALEGYYRRA